MKAKGILSYLLSKPDTWKPAISDIVRSSKDGKDSIATGIRELVDHGYMRLLKHQDKNGKFEGSEWQVSSDPLFKKENAENPQSFEDFEEPEQPIIPQPETPRTGKSDSSNTDKSNTEESNKIDEKDIFQEGKKKEKTSFRNSLASNMEAFKRSLSKEEKIGVDLQYYYDSVMDWSDTKDGKGAKWNRTATGWIATARTFMRGDLEKNKLKLLQKEGIIQEEKTKQDYLEFFKL
jgi:hypothetical protein